jgi:hypothetical protein
VWKIASYSGETIMDRLVLATMLLGNQRLQVTPLACATKQQAARGNASR